MIFLKNVNDVSRETHGEGDTPISPLPTRTHRGMGETPLVFDEQFSK